MNNILNIAQIIISLLLVGGILLQRRGGGLSSAFGGSESTLYSTRRGAEKFIFISTIILAVLFLGISVIRLFI